jgi:hypothetical protein
MGMMRNPYRILFGKREGKNHLADLNMNGRLIFK